MSQPLINLQRLLGANTATAGRVVSISGTLAQIATSGGLVSVIAEAGIQPGDQVTIRSGRATRVQSVANPPQYFL